jgi:hypothetical protein
MRTNELDYTWKKAEKILDINKIILYFGINSLQLFDEKIWGYRILYSIVMLRNSG